MHAPAALVATLNENLYDPLVAEALCRLAHHVVACGPRGNLLKNDLKQQRAADALYKAVAIHEGPNAGAVGWAVRAREVLMRKVND